MVSFVVQALLLRITLKSIYNAHTTFGPHFVISASVSLPLHLLRVFVCSFVRWLLWKQWDSFSYMIENNVPNLPYHNIDFTYFFRSHYTEYGHPFNLHLNAKKSTTYKYYFSLQNDIALATISMYTSTCTAQHRWMRHIASIQYTHPQRI